MQRRGILVSRAVALLQGLPQGWAQCLLIMSADYAVSPNKGCN